MIPVILWKEYREQRAIGAALALLGVVILVGVPLIWEPDPSYTQAFRESLALVAVVLAWTSGLVSGAMLLAGERESNTQAFLDVLPAPRLPVWLAKALAGGLFLLLQIVLLAFLTASRQLVSVMVLPGIVLGMVYAGILGLGWGLCFSARAHSVLGAIGLAILTQLILLPVVPLVATFVFGLLGMALGIPSAPDVAPYLAALLLVALPWPLSAWTYSRLDRQRQPLPLARRLDMVAWWAPWRASFWLARQQSRQFFLGVLLFSLAAGVLVALAGLISWPLFTLGVGALCGVTVFHDEQGGARRFLGEQRFPLTGLWLVKVGVRLGVAFASLVALVLPALVVAFVSLTQRPIVPNGSESFAGRLFGSPLVGLTVPVGLFVFAPVLYGFTLGHVCGLLFRKPLVALVVSGGLALGFIGLWAPSFLAGGLHAWQVMLVPGVLLVCARLLLRPWTGDRTYSLASLGRLAGTAIVCAGLTAAGVLYRIGEIPDVPEPIDLPDFVASLPLPENNEAGLAIRAGLVRLENLSRQWAGKQASRALFPDEKVPPTGVSFLTQAREVAGRGWPPGPVEKQELAGWLDEVFADEAWKRLAQAVNRPTGMIDDPRLLTIGSPDRHLESAQAAGILLPARGLMLARKGDPKAFVENLDVALALVRTLASNSTPWRVRVALGIENMQFDALERWLEQLEGRPDLLRRTGEILARHRAQVPASYRANLLTEYLITRQSLDEPRSWLEHALHHPDGRSPLYEPELLAAVWTVPWERERQRRLLRLLFWDRDRMPVSLWRHLHVVLPSMFVRPGHPVFGLERRIVRLDIARLMVALRGYQAEKGQPATALGQLVPDWLKAIPTDPFAGKPFHYRLSNGEKIVWPGAAATPAQAMMGGGVPGMAAPAGVPEPGREVPAGQGILWSVGEDGKDDGGQRQGWVSSGQGRSGPGEDLIFLVPLEPKKR